MSSQAVRPSTDIDRFLVPISPENPCGESLRYEGTYDKIEQARREDNPNLPQGIWQKDLKQADWSVVEAICTEALEKRSKDLQLAAWLLQAWIRLHGFNGAVRGLALMHALCERYWDGLFPAIEHGDLEFRLGPIRWVNEKLSLDLKLVPITKPTSEDVRPYSWADWEPLLRAAAKPAADAGENTVARFQQSLQMTPGEWLVATHRDVHDAIAECAAFDELIDEKAGDLAPGILRVRAVLEEIFGLLDDVLRHAHSGTIVPVLDTAEVPEDQLDQAEAGLPVLAEQAPAVTIRSRAEAYRLLEAAADFLQRTEPHSPTPYLVRRAVSWGKMSFNELLPELIRNNSELSEIVRLLQVDRDGKAPKS